MLGLIDTMRAEGHAVESICRVLREQGCQIAGRQVRKLTPEGLYGRRKMTALIRRTRIGDASRGAVDRAMRALGLSGIRLSTTAEF